MEIRRQEISLEFQDYIPHPPMSNEQLYAQSCANDKATVDHWRSVWIRNIKANKEKFGSFAENGIGKILGQFKYQPCIVAGAGPSLKHNAIYLTRRGSIPLISCLHNFSFFEDQGIKPEYYVTLDAGEVTVEEVYEGGKKTPQEYWDATKNHTLLAYVGTSPNLLDKWQGKVLFFNARVPDETIMKEIEAVEPFHSYIGTGGNVLGASLYIARAVLQTNPVAFIGADFCFGYDRKFHAWESKYDANLGKCLKVTDVFGNKVLTWQSYHNFKCWFDCVAQQVPGIWINATEGGTMGAYLEGNMLRLQQMTLSAFIEMYHIWMDVEEQFTKPTELQPKLLF